MSVSGKLVQGILTNAPGLDGQGFRDIWLGPSALWSPRDRGRARDWLHGLRPMQEHSGRGAAVACQRLGGQVCTLAAGFMPEFANDEHGRHGFLAHGLWATLDESQQAPDFGSSTLLLLRRFQALARKLSHLANDERLDRYLAVCRRQEDVGWVEPSPEVVLETDEEGCLAVLAWAREPRPPTRVLWPAGDDAPLHLAKCASVLPPRLRLAMPWSYQIQMPTPSSTRVETQSREAWRNPSARNEILVVQRRLRERLRARGKRGIEIIGDWRLASWHQFEQEVLA